MFFQQKQVSIFISIDEISLSFSTEAAANQFADELKGIGTKSNSNLDLESADIIFYPIYSSPDNAAKAVYYAINNYKNSLDSINKFNLVKFSEEKEVNNFIKNIEDYIKEFFGSEAIRIELLNETV